MRCPGKVVEEAARTIKAERLFPPRCPREGWKAELKVKAIKDLPFNQSVDRSVRADKHFTAGIFIPSTLYKGDLE